MERRSRRNRRAAAQAWRTVQPRAGGAQKQCSSSPPSAASCLESPPRQSARLAQLTIRLGNVDVNSCKPGIVCITPEWSRVSGFPARALSEQGQSVRPVDARLQASPSTGGSMKSRRALLATMPFAAVVTSGAFAAPIPCEGLASLHLPDTTITVAAVVPAGAFDPPGATPPIDTAACRVAGLITPTGDSSIAF